MKRTKQVRGTSSHFEGKRHRDVVSGSMTSECQSSQNERGKKKKFSIKLKIFYQFPPFPEDCNQEIIGDKSSFFQRTFLELLIKR